MQLYNEKVFDLLNPTATLKAAAAAAAKGKAAGHGLRVRCVIPLEEGEGGGARSRPPASDMHRTPVPSFPQDAVSGAPHPEAPSGISKERSIRHTKRPAERIPAIQRFRWIVLGDGSPFAGRPAS